MCDRTLANRYEGQTYAYFTVALWSVILTIMYTILFAYQALLYPLYIVSGASGNVLSVRSRALLFALALIALFALRMGRWGDSLALSPNYL